MGSFYNYSIKSNLNRPAYDEAHGRLIVEAIIAAEGVYEYGPSNSDSLRSSYNYIPAEELRKSKFLESCEALAFIDGHEDVTSENYDRLSGGYLYNVREEGGVVKAKIKIYKNEFIEKIISSKNPLSISLAYNAEMEERKGIFKGKKFDGIQRNLNCNHLAFVEEANMPLAMVQNERGENMDKEKEDMKNKEDKKEDMYNASMDKFMKNMQEAMKKMANDFGSSLMKMKNEVDEKLESMSSKVENASSNEEAKVKSSSYSEVVKMRNSVESSVQTKLPDNLDTVDKVLDYTCSRFLNNSENMTKAEKIGFVKALEYFKGESRSQQPVSVIQGALQGVGARVMNSANDIGDDVELDLSGLININ